MNLVTLYKQYTDTSRTEDNITIKGRETTYGDEYHAGDFHNRTLEVEQEIQKENRADFQKRLAEARRTPKNSRAIPVFYCEDFNAPEIKQYQSMGYRNILDLAKQNQRPHYEQLSKSSFHRNRSTNIIIFVLSDHEQYGLKKTTWAAIYNAVINNKTVMVRYKNKQYRNVQLDDANFTELSLMFSEANKTRIDSYVSGLKRKARQSLLEDFKNHKLTVESMALADMLSRLWALEPAQDEVDYQILMETINSYIKAGIQTEEIFVGDLHEEDNEFNIVGRTLIRDINELPLNLKETLQPLLNIQYTTVEYYGNEDLMDASVHGFY